VKEEDTYERWRWKRKKKREGGKREEKKKGKDRRRQRRTLSLHMDTSDCATLAARRRRAYQRCYKEEKKINALAKYRKHQSVFLSFKLNCTY